ncbi:MAG: DUF5666 domain-containing protein [Candidatus Nomurabacteria bacterium]|nr:DUF5666 domain-containing protein [Candidatus Nomurabacteria bacterium]
MKYKRHITTGVLAISLLVGGSSAFAAMPNQDRVSTHISTKGITNNKKSSIVGVVTAISKNGFTVTTNNKLKNKISFDVQTNDLTKFVKDKKQVTSTEIALNQKIIVFGNIDAVSNTIVATKVKKKKKKIHTKISTSLKK